MVKELDFEPEKKVRKGRTGCPERNRVRARERYRNDPEVQKQVKERAKEWKRERRKDPKYRAEESRKRQELKRRAKQPN